MTKKQLSRVTFLLMSSEYKILFFSKKILLSQLFSFNCIIVCLYVIDFFEIDFDLLFSLIITNKHD